MPPSRPLKLTAAGFSRAAGTLDAGPGSITHGRSLAAIRLRLHLLRSCAILAFITATALAAHAHGQLVCMKHGSSAISDSEPPTLSDAPVAPNEVDIGAYFSADLTTVELGKGTPPVPIEQVAPNVFVTKNTLRGRDSRGVFSFDGASKSHGLLTVGAAYLEYYSCFRVD